MTDEPTTDEPRTQASADAATPVADAAGPADPTAPSRERVLEALKAVVDPELGINIVDLGLVYAVDVEGGVVRIEYTLTTMGCPIGPLIEQQMDAVVRALGGVSAVAPQMVIRPPWSPELMSEEAKAALGYF